MPSKTTGIFVCVVLYLINAMLPLTCNVIGCLNSYLIFFEGNGAVAVYFLAFVGLGYYLRPIPLFGVIACLLGFHEIVASIEENYDIFLVHDRPPSWMVLSLMIPIVFAFCWISGKLLQAFLVRICFWKNKVD